MRRPAILLTIAATLLCTVLSGPAAAAPPPSNTQRAATSWAALQRYFAVQGGSGLYHEQYPVQPADNAYSYEWPFSQAHVAALDLSGMPGPAASGYRDALAQTDSAQMHYWSDKGTTGLPGFASYVMPPLGSGGDFFYDDNEWVGLQDMQHYALYRDPASLQQAQAIFRLVESGWDTDPSHADPGGVFWTQAGWSSDRNTVSNMPGAELGLRLYQITRDQSYLDWALKMYRWTNTYL
jgi:Glycosyl hydrolase family 76